MSMRSLGSPGALTGGVSPQRAEDGFSEAVTAGRQGRPERCRTPQESADVSGTGAIDTTSCCVLLSSNRAVACAF